MMRATVLMIVALASFTAAAGEWEGHLARQTERSAEKLMANLSPEFGAPGSVVASRSHRPNYRFHWIRDAALVMDAVVGRWEMTSQPRDEQALWAYADFSRRNQLTPNRCGEADGAGLGEPKFEIDGRAFAGDWGRPQNDGPALRAATLIRFADLLIARGREAEARERLLPILRVDLAYSAAHWRETSFDPWEEVRGRHFYVGMVQRRALLEGAWMLRRLGEPAAADRLAREVPALERELRRHWDAKLGYFVATLDWVEGANYKSSGLDVASLLAVLHGRVRAEAGPSLYAPTDPEALSTALALEREFGQLCAVNRVRADARGERMAPAIGRYPEDRYDGYETDRLGNGWFLATHALAEFYYRAAAQSPDLRQGASLVGRGDEFLRRARFHMNAEGDLSEQINRESGYMQGAENLTWSHASFLTAIWARVSAGR